MIEWRTRALGKPGKPKGLIPSEPLVADPTTDPEVSAQRAIDSSPASAASANRIRSSMAQVSIHPIGRSSLPQ